MLNPENMNLWWDIEPASGDALPHTLLLRPARDYKKSLATWPYIYFHMEQPDETIEYIVWRAIFGEKKNYEESEEVGLESLDSKINRAWTYVYLRREENGEFNFLFYNRFKSACLCTNEGSQHDSRQVFFWGEPDKNAHKAYRVFIPGLSQDEAVTDKRLQVAGAAGQLLRQ